MNTRTQKLLRLIIEDYTKTAQPVASNLLVDKHKLEFSSATIRNEMMALEEEGYLMQPHISAGRIPTEKAYRFYIEKSLPQKELSKNEQKELKEFLDQSKEESIERQIKNLAKNIAAIASETVFVSFSDDNFYYTGITNLFNKPEFSNPELVYSLSQVIDHFDEVVSKISPKPEPELLLGSDNPFGQDCGVVLASFNLKKEKGPASPKRSESGLMGILGPMRMDWAGNLALINYFKKLIQTI